MQYKLGIAEMVPKKILRSFLDCDRIGWENIRPIYEWPLLPQNLLDFTHSLLPPRKTDYKSVKSVLGHGEYSLIASSWCQDKCHILKLPKKILKITWKFSGRFNLEFLNFYFQWLLRNFNFSIFWNIFKIIQIFKNLK